MSFQTLLFEVHSGVATVTLNRPDERNAINDAMRRDFAEIGEELARNPEIRVVVFTGAGRAFSAGGSVDHFEKDWNPTEFRRQSRRLSAFFNEIEALEKPVIAAINGAATGAGLQLAMACDLRIASERATMGYREHRLGLIPGHGGATRLVKLVGLSHAKGLYFKGDLVGAEECYRIGLVHEVVAAPALLESVKRRAEELAARAPAALGLAKRLLNGAADVDVHSGHLLESFAQSIVIKTEDHREGLRAFREKRDPDFRGE